MLVINCKNYEEITRDGIARLVGAAEEAAKEHGVRIAVAPPQHMGAMMADSAVDILAQHVDDKGTGSTTGYVVPELLKESGMSGAIINHSEHRIESGEIEGLVSRMRRLGMISVLCVRDVPETERFAALKPDYIAIEPPELIGSGRAVSKERPDLITSAAAAVGSRSQLLCGAGIVSSDDVRAAVRLGATGVLVASGIVRARDWRGIIGEFAKAML